MNSTYKIQPAGRHILTIGRELIKDKYAAIVELVKNAYDADSLNCTVSLLPFEESVIKDGEERIEKGIKVIIRDEGHGMTFETVTEKWMVPSTDDKFQRNKSPNGRLMQGRKGIGRYSASIIGDDLLLTTIDQSGELTTLFLVWEEFQKAKYLQDVDVLIERRKTNEPSGTEIIICGSESHLNNWDEKQLKSLKAELKKLIPPINRTAKTIDDTENFQITLELGDFPFAQYSNTKEIIEPYPLLELFDYRISGTVSNEGVANLVFENRRIKDLPKSLEPFQIKLNLDEDVEFQSFCGEITFDFRVFDRDPSSIDALIERGLKDPVTGESVGKREARLILDTFNGIGVYRQGFRLRPLGDAGYDWLWLDKRRVQNPSVRIGSDQVIGFIHIEQEDESGLEEKSARDGLKETPEYFGLKEISLQVLKQLENKRFAHRQNVGLGRSKRNINAKIERLYDFSDLREKLDKELDVLGVAKNKRNQIYTLISGKEEKTSKLAAELRQAIAMYQGQATLGKIINVIFHEGRKPLGYFKNIIPLITKWSDDLRREFNQETLDKTVNRLAGIAEQGEILTKLFDKLDPLSSKRRGKKRDFNVLEVLEGVKDIFISELESQRINVHIGCDRHQTIFGWKDDYYWTLTNLVENSIYWLQASEESLKEIRIKVYEDSDLELVVIEYSDNGPGIEKEFIESQIIFEPEFSNKTDGGSGLGLAIAGEAIDRNGGQLKAIYSEKGAFFRIESRIQ